MKWAVVDVPEAVHVVPVLEDGSGLFHEMTTECMCRPEVETVVEDGNTMARPLIVHEALSGRRRDLLRVWNLRRERRGKRVLGVR